MTAITRAYLAFALVALPFAARYKVGKLRRAGVETFRAHECIGQPTQERPTGDLIWIHAASVSESKSALALIERLIQMSPELSVLVTTGTAASADSLSAHLPPRALHQFAPLDGPGPVNRFLDHWRPQLAVFIESELWPNMLKGARRRSIPLALLNARLSQRSTRRWARFPSTTRHLLGSFGIIHVQDEFTERFINDLGLNHARRGVNLKSISWPPKTDELTLARLRKDVGTRPVWAAVTTHRGEEAVMIDAHARLRNDVPDALLVLAPYHPERADEILRLSAGHVTAQRSREENINENTSIYLADTMDETHLWFALAQIVCLCGSFSDARCHTPFEPAAAGKAILHGAHYAEFAEIYARFEALGASLQVSDADTLKHALLQLMCYPDLAHSMGETARPLAQALLEDLDRLAGQCLKLAGIAQH